MRGTRTGSALAVAAATATMMVTGVGTAAAGPPADRGPTRVVEDAAFASLPASDGGPSVFLSLFDVPGEGEIGVVEVFGTSASGDPYECFEGPRIAADLHGLRRGAEAAGSTTLLCGGPTLPADVVAHVHVDATWAPFGRVDTSVVAGRDLPCVSRTRQRAAEVTGTVTVTIPALDVTTTLTGGSGDVRTTTSICRPQHA